MMYVRYIGEHVYSKAYNDYTAMKSCLFENSKKQAYAQSALDLDQTVKPWPNITLMAGYRRHKNHNMIWITGQKKAILDINNNAGPEVCAIRANSLKCRK